MLKQITLIILFAVFCGCAQNASNPTSPPSMNQPIIQDNRAAQNPHNLWGMYQFIFSDDHLSCNAVPVRAADFHLNAMQFLEVKPCTDCLTISNLTPLGGGVIELDVTIHHPFDEPLNYSAFDVKGIIMFNGSLRAGLGYLTYYTYPEIYPGYLSWARRDDWELLNPDGYSYYWSPEFNPDSEWPITHYLPGKFSKGTPTANINAYKEFYTDEDRHLFRAGYSITQTYRIQTQPGPMVVGYAIDACWEPPLVTPVLDPISDFPPTANQPEPYYFEIDINNGEPIHYDECCGDDTGAIKIYVSQWNGMTVTKITSIAYYEIPGVLKDLGCVNDWIMAATDKEFVECKVGCGDNCFCGIELCWKDIYPAGWYRLVTLTYYGFSGNYGDFAVNVTDFYYDPY